MQQLSTKHSYPIGTHGNLTSEEGCHGHLPSIWGAQTVNHLHMTLSPICYMSYHPEEVSESLLRIYRIRTNWKTHKVTQFL